MTHLPDMKEALANLRRTGYVRLGDHSATSYDALMAIYSERSPAWVEAEKLGFALPGNTGVVISGLMTQPSIRLPAVLDWPSGACNEAKPGGPAAKPQKGKTPRAKAEHGGAVTVDPNPTG